MKRLFILTVFFLLAVVGCKISGIPDDTGPIAYQTQILKAYAVPNTVAPGDTVQCVCIIADSTNKNFKYYWSVSPGGTFTGGKKTTFGGVVSYVTSSNHIKWKAPNKIGANYFEVDVDDSSSGLGIPSTAFSVAVK